MHSKNIIKSFSATGLHLFNPSVIVGRFKNNAIKRPNSSSSDTSVLSASDWRKIERLLKKVAIEVNSARNA